MYCIYISFIGRDVRKSNIDFIEMSNRNYSAIIATLQITSCVHSRNSS